MNTEQKQRIIEVAAGLFSKKGIKTISIHRLSQELGISTKTMYVYFKNKEEIVKEIISLGIKADNDILQMLMTKRINPLARLLKTTEYFGLKTRAMYPGIIDDIKKYYPKEYKMVYTFLKYIEYEFHPKYIFKPGIKSGYFRKDIDIKVMSRYIAVMSITFWSLDYYPIEEFGNRNIFGELMKSFLYGIATKKGVKYIDKNLNKFKIFLT